MFYFKPRNLQILLVQCPHCHTQLASRSLARHIVLMHPGKILRAPCSFAPTSLLHGAQLNEAGDLETFSHSAAPNSKFLEFLNGHDAPVVVGMKGDAADLDMSPEEGYRWKNFVTKGILGSPFYLRFSQCSNTFRGAWKRRLVLRQHER